MIANVLVLGLVIVLALLLALGLALAAVVLLRQQRQEQQRLPHEQPMSRSAAPALHPLLHDQTLISVAGIAAASDGRSGAVGQVSVVVGAPRQTHALQPGRPLIIGRQWRHGISLRNDRVSRVHARLVLVNGAVQLTDLGSTNGTFVQEDKRRLAPHTPELLAPGEVFWIGPDVKFSVDPAQELAAPKKRRWLDTRSEERDYG
jgi:hypothetical protein